MQSALVTGGTGFVGGAIVRALSKRGGRVRVLARRTSKTEHLKAPGIEIVYGDILDRQSMVNALKGCDTLYHAAALYDLWGLDERALMQTECEGTRNALEAAMAVGVGKVIYTSTAVTIGERKGETGAETTEHRGYFLSTYERAKYEAERIAVTCLTNGLPLIMINPAGIYGPGDLKPTGRFIMNFLNGRLPALMNGINSLVYVDDVATGHVLAAEKGRIGERYILSGDIVTLKEWAGVLSDLSGITMPFFSIPTFLAGSYAIFGEIGSLLTKRPPVLSWENFRLVSHGFRADGSKAARELGMNYTPFKDGLLRAITWYWEQGMLKRKPACV